MKTKIPVLKMEINVDEQVIHPNRQLLHASSNTQIGQMTYTANIEAVWLFLLDS